MKTTIPDATLTPVTDPARDAAGAETPLSHLKWRIEFDKPAAKPTKPWLLCRLWLALLALFSHALPKLKSLLPYVLAIAIGGGGVATYHRWHVQPAPPAPIHEDVVPVPEPPAPTPPPKPEPPKTISAGRMVFIGVVQSVNSQSDTQASIETSVELAKLLDSKGNYKRWVDGANAPAQLKPFVDQAAKDGLPRCLIVDWGEQKVVASQPMTDVSAAIALAKKWGGE